MTDTLAAQIEALAKDTEHDDYMTRWTAKNNLAFLLHQNLHAILTALRQAEAAPGVVEALEPLAEMLRAAVQEEGRTIFEHSPEEIGAEVMEHHASVLQAIARQHGAREGYVLVPREPTEEMTRAGWTAITNPNNVIKQSAWHAQQVYAAMIAAAPATDVGEA